jgi:hypothetical protein
VQSVAILLDFLHLGQGPTGECLYGEGTSKAGSGWSQMARGRVKRGSNLFSGPVPSRYSSVPSSPAQSFPIPSGAVSCYFTRFPTQGSALQESALYGEGTSKAGSGWSQMGRGWVKRGSSLFSCPVPSRYSSVPSSPAQSFPIPSRVFSCYFTRSPPPRAVPYRRVPCTERRPQRLGRDGLRWAGAG